MSHIEIWKIGVNFKNQKMKAQYGDVYLYVIPEVGRLRKVDPSCQENMGYIVASRLVWL